MVQAASYGAFDDRDTYQTVVPVDVYQDVVAELKETQALARNLEIQNRELWQQNQQLQAEMAKVMGAVQTFQQRATKIGPAEEAPEVVAIEPRSAKTKTTPAPQRKTIATQAASLKYTAIDDDIEEDLEREDIGGWNMIITVICIIAVGVSVGYTAFRPAR
jgi:hypothetical protein